MSAVVVVPCHFTHKVAMTGIIKTPTFIPVAPVDVEGNAEMATVVDLSPWTQYDFRVMATNTLGTGEPSAPLLNVTTLASCKALTRCFKQHGVDGVP